MKPIAVSVVIPCYNYAAFLPEAVESVVNQTYMDFEIIIVNDGSTDDTLTVANELAEKYSHVAIRVIDQENQGISEARNNGIRIAAGRYIMLLDADDMIRPACIEALAAVLDNSPGVSVAHPRVEEFGARTRAYGRKVIGGNLRRNNFICGCSMFRKDAWEKVDGYKQVMRKGYEDWEFWVSLAEAGYNFMQVDKPLYLYRVHQYGGRDQRAGKVRTELVFTMRSLHPGYFAPVITKYIGEGAARKYFRLRMPLETAWQRISSGVLRPVYLSIKPLVWFWRKYYWKC